MHRQISSFEALLEEIIQNIKNLQGDEQEAEVARFIRHLENGVPREFLPETISSLFFLKGIDTIHSEQLEELRLRFLLAEWIYKQRTELGYVIGRVEELSGVNRGYISRLERGAAKLPSKEIILKLSSALGKLPTQFQTAEFAPKETVNDSTYDHFHKGAAEVAMLVNELPLEYQEWLATLTRTTFQWVKENHSQELKIMGLTWEKAGTTKQNVVLQIVQFLLRLDQTLLHQILGELFVEYVDYVDAEDVPAILRMYTKDIQTIPTGEKFVSKTKRVKDDDQ